MIDDEILDYNNQIVGWIDILSMSKYEYPDVREFKEDDKQQGLSILFDIVEHLKEAYELLDILRNYYEN